MKRVMWIVAMIPFVCNCIMIIFLPDIIPVHYDIDGNIDGWGNKTEGLIYPIVILIVTLLMHLFMLYFEKKQKKSNSEKEKTEAKANLKFVAAVGILQALIMCVMNFVFMYSAFAETSEKVIKMNLDFTKILCVMIALACIVMGNLLTKTKKNGVAGVRNTWSMYNEITWRKCNLFGAVGLIIVGFLTIFASVFVDGILCVFIMVALIFVDVIVTCVYSKKVYDSEMKEKGKVL